MRKIKTTPAQARDAIAHFHKNGETDDAIALKLGMTRNEVTQQREAMGLETATTVAITWTTAEDEKILSLRDERNLLWAEIASRLGTGKLRQQVQARYKELDDERNRRPNLGEPKFRNCNRCKKKFWSEHHGIRSCDPCRGRPERDSDNYIMTHGPIDWGSID